MEDSIFLIKNPINSFKDCYFSYCGISENRPKHSFGPAIREHYLVHLVLDGKGYYSIDNKKYHLQKGQGFVIPPNASAFYQGDSESPWSYVWMGIGGELINIYLENIGISKNNYIFDVPNINDLNDFKAIIYECFAYDDDSIMNELILQKQLFNFLALLTRAAKSYTKQVTIKKMNPYVNKTLELLQRSSYMNISVSEISKNLSINSSYLSRLFKEQMGMSIKKYVNEIRIKKSCDLLSATSYSIQEISEMVGFSGPQSFSKAFKQMNDVTPTRYRQKRIGVGKIR